MDNPWEQKWKILRPLSGGGQGDTFIVQPLDQSSQERVLKRLKPSKSQDLKARARMHREVTSLSTLASEGARVPRIYDGNTGDFEKLDVPLFFVMDYIEGRTLDRVMKEDGIMTVDKAVALCLDLCRTLKISITAGIAHRDIKPENLTLRDSNANEVVMLDSCSPGFRPEIYATRTARRQIDPKE
jgi:serine/threonine-protein kinase